LTPQSSLLAQIVSQPQNAIAHVLHSRVHAILPGLTPSGRLPATNRLNLVIGLPVRNRADLEIVLKQLYDPASTNFEHFLTPAQFTAKFGPTLADYQAVITFARTNAFRVVRTYDSRKIVDVSATVSDIEKAFHVTLRMYQHPTEARQFYAPDVEASVDAMLPILDVSGLDNYVLPHSMAHLKTKTETVEPATGSGPGGNYRGLRWTPKIRPLVKLDFCRFAVDKKEQTYESKTETTQCGLQG
jgi:subtilase family serine protease